MRDREALIQHLDDLAGNHDEMAWLTFVGYLDRLNSDLLSHREEEFNALLAARPLGAEPALGAVHSVREQLLAAQTELQDHMQELAGEAAPMAALYEEYERLQQRHSDLMGEMAVRRQEVAENARRRRREALDA